MLKKAVNIIFATVYFLVSSYFMIQETAVASQNNEQESRHLGRVVSTLITHEYVILDNPSLITYLNNILKEIVSVNNIENDYRIIVINDFIPNSFSDPEGTLYITSGLLDIIENDDEIACILAHEIAHVESYNMLNAFDGIITQRKAVIATGIIVSAALVVATVGMSAAAMGPMGTATSSSTMITNIGSFATTSVLSATVSPPKFENTAGLKELSKARLGRVGIKSEPEQHPVYAPALFGVVIYGIYKGYGAEEEAETNKLASRFISNTSFEMEGLQSLGVKIVKNTSEEPNTHLESYLRQYIENKK